ncbi:hypothetical protein GCM10023321_48290 [Pseudonocardia eucalypti]|uniref:Uncharacterized protein n=1 Tax=Pseudonocardia eucalypti TaxID=648755 RepID=A0ABP9QIT6_9PSEU
MDSPDLETRLSDDSTGELEDAGHVQEPVSPEVEVDEPHLTSSLILCMTIAVASAPIKVLFELGWGSECGSLVLVGQRRPGRRVGWADSGSSGQSCFGYRPRSSLRTWE